MAEAEDKALFVLTRRVKEALGLINALEESKLSVIVRRLVKRIGEKGAPFSATELEQLQEVLELAESQVRHRPEKTARSVLCARPRAWSPVRTWGSLPDEYRLRCARLWWPRRHSHCDNPGGCRTGTASAAARLTVRGHILTPTHVQVLPAHDFPRLQQRLCSRWSGAQVDTVLEGCAFFLEQSAYHVIKPEQLSAHLQAAGMIQSHARAFSGAWEAEATGVLRRLRALSQGIHPTLESLDWRLHVQTASSGLTKLAEPRAVVSLKLKSLDDKDEVVPLELDRAQMAELLTQLDAAQQQLDALS